MSTIGATFAHLGYLVPTVSGELLTILSQCSAETSRNRRMMQMMSLHTFDQTYSPQMTSGWQLSPLMSPESLRRLAWAVLYADTFIDGGRYGYHGVDEESFRVKLPCGEEAFLANETSTASAVSFSSSDADPLIDPTFDLSAHLIRTATLRRRILHFAFRLSHGEFSIDDRQRRIAGLDNLVHGLMTMLPRRYHFNADTVRLHHDRLPMLVLLHLLRHILYIAMARAKLMIYQNDIRMAHLIPSVRRERITHAQSIAGIVAQAQELGAHFDMQSGVFAYISLESELDLAHSFYG